MIKNAVISRFFVVSISVCLTAVSVLAQTTEFTYQGKLADTVMPQSATYDFEFRLCVSETNCASPLATQPRSGVAVSGGIFTVKLDFGATHFTGADRWLEIAVKRPAEANYTALLPRQRITSAPYAIRAANATSADALSAACVTCVTDAQITGVAGSKVTGSVANATNATTATTAGNVTGIVAIANGGTGSSTRNFVDLTSTENIGGGKTFTSPVNTLADGYKIAGNRVLSIIGSNNLFVGANAGTSASGSINNAFIGASAGQSNTTGNQNSFVGSAAGFNNTTGSNNSFFGAVAGQINSTGEYNTVIGSGANLNANNRAFTTLIGALAIATGDDQIVLGKVAGTYFVNGVNGFRPADTVRIPGNLIVTGSITGATKSFKIDYPLDPLNKTLTYTSIESPDIKNIYDGNVTTDGRGEAIVTLPDYFEALNKDYRYQLTVIGTFAQAIVSDEIKGNSFKIKTDKPGVKVSWQVTGIRRDKFAEDNRAPNVQDKPETEKGKCLYAPACGAASTGETRIKQRP